jgi:hypothetical protein
MKSKKSTLFEKAWRRVERKWEYSGVGKLVQSALYRYIELSQWNPSYYTCTRIQSEMKYLKDKYICEKYMSMKEYIWQT